MLISLMFQLAPSPQTADKSDLYRLLVAQSRALLEDERDPIARAANLASLLYHQLPGLNWAGFYFWNGSELVLGPFQGNRRAPVSPGAGVCAGGPWPRGGR